MVPALCTSSDDPLSMYQVSFNSLPYFRNVLRTNFLLQKVKKVSNSVNTGDMVTVFVFCNSSHSPLSVYHLSFI